MPLYTCPRCNYNTRIKTHMLNHLNRINKCKPIYNDISIETLKNTMFNTKNNVSQKTDNFPQKTDNFPQKTDNFPQKTDNLPQKTNNVPQIDNLPQKTDNVPQIDNLPQKTYNLSCIDNLSQNDIILSNKLKMENKQGFVCDNCNKVYSRKHNLSRHKKKCIKKNNQVIDTNQELYTKTQVETIINKTKEEFYLKETQNLTIITELRKQVESLLKNQGNNNVTYNTNIILNAFGKENISYISNDYLKGLISSGPVTCIPKLLKHIHFNPEHSENHNIKITNKKEPYAQIYNGTNWEISDKKQTIENMTDKAYSILNEHYTGNNVYMLRFKEQYEDNCKMLTKKLSKDTEIMIINSQKILT